MNIKYFSWLRDRIGIEEEDLELELESISVKELIDLLAKKSDRHFEALKDTSIIRCAVNLEVVNFDHKIGKNDEVALFPPMTGG